MNLEKTIAAPDSLVDHALAPNALAEKAEKGHRISLDDATNKRLYRMVVKRVLPLMCLAYLMQALDKDYALSSTFLWIGVIVGEFPANRATQVLPVAKLLSGSVGVWGVLLLGMGFAKDRHYIFAIRALLGLFESVIGPVLLSISLLWFRTEELPFITSCWQSMVGLSNALTGLLGFAFAHIERGSSSLYSWQYLFIAVAILSFMTAVTIGALLPDSPATAKCYSDFDRILLVERIRVNDQGLKNKTFKRNQAWECITDPYVWLLFLIITFNTLVVGGLGAFLGLLINAFGFTPLQSQLLNIPLGVLSIIFYLTTGYVAKRSKQTYLTMAAFTIPNIVGTVVIITVPPTLKTRAGLLIAFYIMQFFVALNPLIFSLLARNVAGQTKRTVAYAIVFIGWAGGNACAPQLFQSKWAPRYLPTLYIHLGLYAVFLALVATSRGLLVRRNRIKERAARHEVGSTENEHTHAFDDLTDKENPGFRYSV